LASCLNYPFIDTDEEIVLLEGTTISDIFRKKGEDHFRLLEHRLTESLLEQGFLVVSCGGGLPLFYNHMALLNTAGTTVFIKPAFDLVFKRLLASRNERPLLADVPEEQLYNFALGLYHQRLAVYRECRYTINPSYLSPDSFARFLQNQLPSSL
jgi:shikimate kinase